jgi:hypothetical protein
MKRNKRKKAKKKKKRLTLSQPSSPRSFSTFQIVVFVILAFLIYEKFFKTKPQQQPTTQQNENNQEMKQQIRELRELLEKKNENKEIETRGIKRHFEITNYDPRDLTIRRGKLPIVKNLSEVELKEMKSGGVNLMDIFDFIEDFRSKLPPKERFSCFAHHNLEGYGRVAINLMMIWPENGGTPIRALNTILIGTREGVMSTRNIGSTRNTDPTVTKEIKTHETIHIRYIDADLEQLKESKYDARGNYRDSRTTERRLSGNDSPGVEIALWEMDRNDPFDIK